MSGKGGRDRGGHGPARCLRELTDQRQEFARLISVDGHAGLGEDVCERLRSALLAQRELVVPADQLGIDGSKAARDLEHSLDVDPRLVREDFVSDERLVVCDGESSDPSHEGREPWESRHVDSSGNPEHELERGNDLVKRGNAGPISQSVHGHMNLRRARLDASKHVRLRKPEIVVHVHLEIEIDGAAQR